MLRFTEEEFQAFSERRNKGRYETTITQSAWRRLFCRFCNLGVIYMIQQEMA